PPPPPLLALLGAAPPPLHADAASSAVRDTAATAARLMLTIFIDDLSTSAIADLLGMLALAGDAVMVGSECHQLTAMYLLSVKARRPSTPPSRPSPLSLTPPNGAAGSDTSPRLRPTIPASIRSLTRRPRARSAVYT